MNSISIEVLLDGEAPYIEVYRTTKRVAESEHVRDWEVDSTHKMLDEGTARFVADMSPGSHVTDLASLIETLKNSDAVEEVNMLE